MLKILIMTDFGIKLLQWYRENQRELPWRSSKDPYKIWLSEIILQQTQVVQGTNYYLKFVNSFPNIQSLANADEETVLKLWQGLGYYSRARNLHASAKLIVEQYDGKFPQSYQDILKLKGVGPYTAAAIASFCFGEPYAAVDGNVYRFISRLKGIHTAIDTGEGKKEFALTAQDMLNVRNPGDHNQAMIEFGALVCRPANPSCQTCLFNKDCVAFRKNYVADLPVKSKKVKQRKRYFNYFFIEADGRVYIEKRINDDIWKNLYQLPMVETEKKVAINKVFSNADVRPMLIDKRKHILSHQIIEASFYMANEDILKQLKGNYISVEKEVMMNYPFPQLVVNFLSEKIGLRQD